MKCSKCNKSHATKDHHHYTVKEKLTDTGFPTHSKKYGTAHEEASKAEKKKFPSKNYEQLKHLDESIPKGKLLGKNTQHGKIEVSKMVPKSLRSEVAFHERAENKILRKNK